MISKESSPIQMLEDPDEGPFLRTILGSLDSQTADAAVWLRYAEFLEDRNDPRGEFVRLEHLLSARDSPEAVASIHQARYARLLELLEPYEMWLRLVIRNDRLLNCGQATDHRLAMRFHFTCPNRWETMAPTPEAGVRYCADCQKKVYFCDDAESVERHARAGDCITAPLRVTSLIYDELTRSMTGMPDVHELWGEKIFRGLDENADSDRRR
jgi:uncharacterized protein (TIGR02996 family)